MSLPLRGILRNFAEIAMPASVPHAVSMRNFMQFSSSGGGNSDLTWLQGLDPDRGNESQSSPPPKDPHRSRRLGIIIAVSLLLIACAAVFGLALYIAFMPGSNNEVASPQSDITCQELIDRAMEASGDYCDQIGSNQVCYGNNTLSAELNSGENTKFASEGDVVSVADLRRLAASPLNLASEEWGIAVFKVLANLPRSLPGETITMVVFGNTTLDNPSSNLQSFYFSSTLGQIQCDEVPFDGLMITMPDGAGVRFIINGADMTLMGNASISATQNGSMEVSLYSGSAIISANGGTQLVTAGENTSMELGGPNGNSAVSPPSPPQPLSPEELALACTLTGQFCSPEEITPVSPGDFLATLQVQMGLTSTPTSPVTSTFPPTLSSTTTPSPTPSLSATFTRTGTLTRTVTRTLTRTGTQTITTTRTQTSTPTRTLTPTTTRTNTPNSTGTITATFTPTRTLTFTPTYTLTSTWTPTNTSTDTATPVDTNTPTSTAISVCSSFTSTSVTTEGPPNKQMLFKLTNGSGSTATVTQLTIANGATLVKITSDSQEVWNGSDSSNPKIITAWTGSVSDRQVAGSGGSLPMILEYQNPISSEATTINITIDGTCDFNISYP
jgi:hypothetical protein